MSHASIVAKFARSRQGGGAQAMIAAPALVLCRRKAQVR
jgi:hypothetical protein